MRNCTDKIFMKKFHLLISQIKKEQGFTSTKKFFEFLSEDKAFDFNYSYFRKVESGGQLPSEKFVNSFVRILPQKYTNIILKTYCQNLFSKFSYVFEDIVDESVSEEKIVEEEVICTNIKDNQELTPLECAVISKTKEHYFFFLILTLSRKGIVEDNLSYFSTKEIKKIIDDFKKVKLLKTNLDGEILATNTERRFPKENMEDLFKKLDLWDLEFAQFFNLNEFKRKTFIRRVSPRYLSLIELYLNTLFETLRVSDESDSKFNTEVIHFQLSVDVGKIPG